jgi:purine-binding chemotaxis protein CheW
MLSGFVQEAHSYLPQIRESLETFQHDATQREVLEEALRSTHTIKGASAMVGLPVLSHIANYVEGTLEEVVTGQRAMDTACSTWLQQTMDQLEHYLDGLLSGDMQQQALVAEVVQSFRRFKNLPEAGDMAALKAAIGGQEEEATALEAQSQDQPHSPTTAVTSDDQTAPVPEPAYAAETPGPLDALVAAIDHDVHQVYGQNTKSTVPPGQLDGQNQTERYVLFTLAGSRYAVPVPSILEIGRILPITPVPNVPAWVRGVINLRGEILSVIDFRTFLGLEEAHHGEHSRMLVVKTARDEIMTSLIVDQVMGIAPLSKTRMETPAATPGNKVVPYLDGAYEYEDQVCAVFDLERLLLSPEVRQFE